MNAYKRYKNRLEQFLQTERGKRFINFAYSFGAAIVILGAMFKLLHFHFGNEMLFIGMATECIVFILSAFDTPIHDYNWESAHTEEYGKQMENLNRTLSGLNSIYEIQLKNVGNQIDAIEQINQRLSRLRSMYGDTLPDESVIKTETEKMADQLRKLNDVYARMLNAMTVNRHDNPGNSNS